MTRLRILSGGSALSALVFAAGFAAAGGVAGGATALGVGGAAVLPSTGSAIVARFNLSIKKYEIYEFSVPGSALLYILRTALCQGEMRI